MEGLYFPPLWFNSLSAFWPDRRNYVVLFDVHACHTLSQAMGAEAVCTRYEAMVMFLS